VIGRGEVDLVIEDPELSRRHAVVRPADGGVAVEDLGSRNGTWVNGRRIAGSVLLAETSTLRLGTSEIRIDVAPPGATVVREVARPGDTAARPGATVERPRVAPPPPQPAPAQAAAAQAPSVAPPPPAPSTEAAPAPRGQPGRRPRPPLRARLPFLIAALVVGAIVVLLILAQTGGSAEERALSAHLRLGTVSDANGSALLAGVQTGPPTGTGTATVDLIFRPPKGASSTSPGAVSGKLVSRFDNGSITSILTLRATRQGGTTQVSGRGKASGGTGDYDGVTGSFTYRSTQERGSNRVTATLKGTLKY